MNSREREEQACLVALASLDGIGPATLLSSLAAGSVVEDWHRLRSGRPPATGAIAAAARRSKTGGIDRFIAEARALDADAVLAQHEAAGQRVLVFGRDGYPVRLLEDPAPPAVLFAQGTLDVLDGPTVAIVGTRNCTRLGRATAGALALELSEGGVSVVSGLALGIDGAAHVSLVDGCDPPASHDGAGRPVGVVATGLERAYPRRHHVLHQQVAAAGLLLSETPIGGDASRWRFPARNRIIAGLADAVVVVESRSAGGSMLTAGEALARDVPVLAVPGHPSSPAAAGPLDLICDGAMPVRDVTDVLVAIGMGGRTVTPSAAPPPVTSDVSPTALDVLADLDPGPCTLAELVLRSTLELEAVSAALVELETAALVVRSGAWFERSERAASASSGGPIR